MSDEFEIARNAFRKFCEKYRANPARNSGIYDTDPPLESCVYVPPDETVAQFVKLNPQWKKHEEQLVDCCPEIKFRMRATEWEQLKKQNESV